MENWAQFWGILVPLVTLFGFLYKEIKSGRAETREEIQSIREEIRAQAARSDKLYEIFQEEMRSQTTRSDRLYEMFIAMMVKPNQKTHP